MFESFSLIPSNFSPMFNLSAMLNFSIIPSNLSVRFKINNITPIATGIIQLRHTRKEDTMERTIQVTKMRGIKHSEQIHPIVIDGDGMHIQHPRLTP